MFYQTSDATLLQAILFGWGSSSISLNSVHSTVVGLDREMLTFDEFDGGLASLMSSGLGTLKSGLITPTTNALDIASEISGTDGCPDPFHAWLVKSLHDWSALGIRIR